MDTAKSCISIGQTRCASIISTSFRGYSIPIENAASIAVNRATIAPWIMAVQVNRLDQLLYEIVGWGGNYFSQLHPGSRVTLVMVKG